MQGQLYQVPCRPLWAARWVPPRTKTAETLRNTGLPPPSSKSNQDCLLVGVMHAMMRVHLRMVPDRRRCRLHQQHDDGGDAADDDRSEDAEAHPRTRLWRHSPSTLSSVELLLLALGGMESKTSKRFLRRAPETTLVWLIGEVRFPFSFFWRYSRYSILHGRISLTSFVGRLRMSPPPL